MPSGIIDSYKRVESVYIFRIFLFMEDQAMSSSTLEEAVKEIKAIREKVERIEEIVEERLLGIEKPMKDEAEAIKGYLEAKKRGDIQLTPLENLGKKA